MKLTNATVKSLKIEAGKSDLIAFDDELPGFGIRIRETGARTWIVQYKLGAKHRRITIGTPAMLDAAKARKTAGDLLAKVRLGHDPAGEKDAARASAVDTLGTAVELFLKRQEARVRQGNLRERSLVETRRYLTTHWRPLHGLTLAKVVRANVAARLAQIATDNGETAAARARAALSAFFTWATREGLAEANPVVATNTAIEYKERDRVLTDAELRAVWNALPDNQFGAIVKLLALTGQRRDEIAALRWAEIDLERRLIALPGERTKNGLPHDVPLSAAAIAILQAQPVRADRALVFGEGQGGYQGWSKSKAALDTVAKIAPWRLHDLRRTAATNMGELGALPHVIEAALNHKSGHKRGVAGTYNKAIYATEKREALDKLAKHVLEAVGERPKLTVVA